MAGNGSILTVISTVAKRNGEIYSKKNAKAIICSRFLDFARNDDFFCFSY